MDFVISIIPLAVMIVILVMKKHMLLAGLLGAVCVVILGMVPLAEVDSAVVAGFGTMFGAVHPILYAAAAAMAAKAGCFNSLVALCERWLKGRRAALAFALVIIQAFATYMAGMGAGNTMVIAPLVFAAIGAVPEVIAGMAIATATCFICSPASTQAVVVAENCGIDVQIFANTMLPFAVVFVIVGAVLAAWGVYRRGKLLSTQTAAETSGDKEVSPVAEFAAMTSGKLFKISIPVIVLLVLVVCGGLINNIIGISIFVPTISVIIVAILIPICTSLSVQETCDSLVEGSLFILKVLFAVSIFLGFINLMDSQLGTFANLANLASLAPDFIILPVAMILAFLIAIPSGAFCAGVLALILPTLALMGFSPVAMGFIALATGLGTQVSPVQINVAALSDGFKKEVMEICTSNMKYMVPMLAVLIVVGVIVA